MHTIDLIRQTLDALFAQYRAFNKNTFALSLNIVLIIFLAVVIVALPIFLLVAFLRLSNGSGGEHMPLLEQLYYPETLYRIRLENFSYAINLFGMAIFGYYLLRPTPETTPLKSTRDVFEYIPSGRWPLLLLLLGAGILFRNYRVIGESHLQVIRKG